MPNAKVDGISNQEDILLLQYKLRIFFAVQQNAKQNF